VKICICLLLEDKDRRVRHGELQDQGDRIRGGVHDRQAHAGRRGEGYHLFGDADPRSSRGGPAWGLRDHWHMITTCNRQADIPESRRAPILLMFPWLHSAARRGVTPSSVSKSGGKEDEGMTGPNGGLEGDRGKRPKGKEDETYAFPTYDTILCTCFVGFK